MTTARIEKVFRDNRAAGRTTLVAYLTVGYRDVEESYQAARAALEAGADVLELGVPFSDPSADGPVIAAASYEAIETGGGSLRAALSVAERLRQTSEAPFVLFSYYNPVVAFGEAELVAAVKKVDADGLLLVDLPPEEGRELRAAAREASISIIPLVAPTTDIEREQTVLRDASGFVYYVSVTGVTGSGAAPLEAAGKHAVELEERFGVPVVVGFGIDSVEKARLAARSGASGVVVGTALVRALGGAPPGQGARAVGELVRALREGLDAK